MPWALSVSVSEIYKDTYTHLSTINISFCIHLQYMYLVNGCKWPMQHQGLKAMSTDKTSCKDTCPTSTMGQPTLHYNLTAKVTFSGDNRAINKLGMSSKAQSVSNLAELRSKEPSCKHSICRILEAQATDTWYGELGSIEYLPSGTSAPYPPDQKECEWEVPRSKDSACDTCRASITSPYATTGAPAVHFRVWICHVEGLSWLDGPNIVVPFGRFCNHNHGDVEEECPTSKPQQKSHLSLAIGKSHFCKSQCQKADEHECARQHWGD